MSKRQTLNKERSFDGSTGRPTKYFKLDRTYSDVVEDELYDPQPDPGRTSPVASGESSNAESRTERIQNVFPQLFNAPINVPESNTRHQKTEQYWPGMESGIRFDRDDRDEDKRPSSIIADRKQKLKQQPEQSTVSPKEAFLDYPDNADFDKKGSVFATTNPRPDELVVSLNRESSSSATSASSRGFQFPSLSSQQSFGEMTVPKTITPVRAHERASPRPVSMVQQHSRRGQQQGSVPLGPNRIQAHDNASANMKIRALYKEESNTSAGSEVNAASSLADSDSDYATQSPPNSRPTAFSFVCQECHEAFDRANALEAHLRAHARPPVELHAKDKIKSISHHIDDDHDFGEDDDDDRDEDHDDTGANARLKHKAGGPHRCDWVIPSSGQVCGTVFSRPYDLVRHQDTIHRAKKLEFRCEICIAAGTNKIFSRNDALVRHMRHVHKRDLPRK